VVVDAEITGTNKTTRKSEGNSVLEKRKEGQKNRKKGLDRADIVRDFRLRDISGVDLIDAELCQQYYSTKTSARCGMKYRVAIWAFAGFLVASGWAVYFLVASKNLPIQPMVSALVRLTCPIAIVGSHHPVSLYLALAANVATYALVGLVVETLRRQLNHSN
jgi:hypothetical protein